MTHGEFTLKFSQMLTEYEKEIKADERAKTIEDVMIAFKSYQNMHNPKDAHIFWEQLSSMKGDTKNERL